MLFAEWNEEEALEYRYNEGIKKGIEKGIEKGHEEDAIRAISQGLPLNLTHKIRMKN